MSQMLTNNITKVMERKTKHNHYRRYFINEIHTYYYVNINNNIITSVIKRINANTDNDKEFCIKSSSLPSCYLPFLNIIN